MGQSDLPTLLWSRVVLVVDDSLTLRHNLTDPALAAIPVVMLTYAAAPSTVKPNRKHIALPAHSSNRNESLGSVVNASASCANKHQSKPLSAGS